MGESSSPSSPSSPPPSVGDSEGGGGGELGSDGRSVGTSGGVPAELVDMLTVAHAIRTRDWEDSALATGMRLARRDGQRQVKEEDDGSGRCKKDVVSPWRWAMASSQSLESNALTTFKLLWDGEVSTGGR